jgi:hypothetical protein
MSLINDALKRAREHTAGASVRPSPALPARPEHDPGKSILLVVIVSLIAVAGLLMGLAFLRPAPKPASPQVTVPALPAAASDQKTVAAPAQLSDPPPRPAVAIDTSDSLPKLQGILYDPFYPEAIVNGKTLHVGNLIGNYRVKTITKFAVTLIDSKGVETDIHMEK